MNGRFILSIIDSVLRLGALACIWGMTAIAAGIFFGFAFTGAIVFFLVSPIAFILSHFILQRKFIAFDEPPARALPPPPRVDALSTRDLLALLDEDDLDDLRAEVRESLRSRIHRLSGDDADTFEDLLLENGKRKRSVR